MAALIENVHVFDADGVAHVFGPGADVPDWAAKLITNPAAWDEVPEAADGEGGDEVAIPSRGGAGSGAGAWAEYAKAKGFEVPADASREEIIEALAAEGIPTA